MCCRKEYTPSLNSVVLVYHSGRNNILPKSVPSLSTHRDTIITSCFETGRSIVLLRRLSSFYRKLSLDRFVYVFQNRRRTWVAMKVCRVLKMWLPGDSSMNVSGFLSSLKSIQKNSVIQLSSRRERSEKENISTFFLEFLITK